MKIAFLVTPKNEISGWTFQSDRDYFSNPVEVEIIRVDDCGLVIVTDHRRGHTYPVNRSNLKSKHQLTNKQAAALAGIFQKGIT